MPWTIGAALLLPLLLFWAPNGPTLGAGFLTILIWLPVVLDTWALWSGCERIMGSEGWGYYDSNCLEIEWARDAFIGLAIVATVLAWLSATLVRRIVR